MLPAWNVSHIFFWQIGDTSIAWIEWLKKRATIKEKNERGSVKESLASSRLSACHSFARRSCVTSPNAELARGWV